MSQIALLQETLDFLKYKCWFYDMAKKLGRTVAVLNHDEKDIPSEFLKIAHRSKKSA